jgi:hypothetical protein
MTPRDIPTHFDQLIPHLTLRIVKCCGLSVRLEVPLALINNVIRSRCKKFAQKAWQAMNDNVQETCLKSGDLMSPLVLRK